MPKGLIQGPTVDSSIVWVKVPEGKVTGKTIQVLLESLARQIRMEHMERRVKRFGTDKATRRIIVEFEEEINDG